MVHDMTDIKSLMQRFGDRYLSDFDQPIFLLCLGMGTAAAKDGFILFGIDINWGISWHIQWYKHTPARLHARNINGGRYELCEIE
jgi:hypothetical protein